MAAALYHIKFDQCLNENSVWKNKNVKVTEPIEVFDSSDELHSYIVNLQIGGQSAGYIEIGNNKNDFPVLSYSYTVNNTEIAAEDYTEKLNNDETSLKSKDSLKKIKSKKVVCISPGRFGIKIDYTDNSAELFFNHKKEGISSLNKKHEPKKERNSNNESKNTWDNIESIVDGISTGDIGTDSDGVTDSILFEFNNPYTSTNSGFNSGVPNQKQYYSSLWTGPSGCTPTSAYNIYYYWHYTGGKTNLLKNKSTGVIDKDNTILLLRNNMQTNDNGFTDLYNQASALVAVARYKGYSGATSTLNAFASWSTVKSDLNYGPSLISMTGHTFFNDHTLTGVGYIEFIRNGSSYGHQYIETYDNSQMTTTTGSVYIAYGRDYTTLSSINFRIN